jgi:hypothetical protein
MHRAFESVHADPGGETEEIETRRSDVQGAALGVVEVSRRAVQPVEGVGNPAT